MSKSLEALERIIGCSTIESHTKKWQQDYLIVEQELKRFEELEKAFIALSKDDEKAKKLLSKEIEKNRVLEIIRKTISTDLQFDYEEDTERWYVWIDCEGYQVYIFEGQGKEQYDLLKEVLL